MCTCRICGNKFEGRSWGSYPDICSSSDCFDKALWLDRQEQHQKKLFIIINGTMYSDGGNVENPNRYQMLGYGGSRFNIKMNDGTEISTNNLWCGGEIPEENREVMSDNAIFIR